MIPILIWVCRKYLAPKIYKIAYPKKMELKKKAVILFFFLSSVSSVSAHLLVKTYNIKRNGEVIGKLSFNQNVEGENVYLKITSQVSTRFLFKIDVKTEDSAHFKNGKLISSDVSRLVNGKAKERKKTNLINDAYQLQSGTTLNNFNQSIGYSMMQLYAKEPVNISQVYSDNFQCFLPIKKNAEHQYRVNLPDGNYNDYHFENGVCKLIIVNHSLYTIRMELV